MRRFLVLFSVSFSILYHRHLSSHKNSTHLYLVSDIYVAGTRTHTSSFTEYVKYLKEWFVESNSKVLNYESREV